VCDVRAAVRRKFGTFISAWRAGGARGAFGASSASVSNSFDFWSDRLLSTLHLRPPATYLAWRTIERSESVISVVVPIHDTPPDLLDACFGSVLAQSHTDWELCACDDGSTRPDTLECLATYRGSDPRIRIVRSEVSLSYRAGCPVGPSQLTTIDMNHWGFDGTIHRGRLIVRTDVAARVIASFQAAFAARFPFRVMQDPSAYGNDDRVSMAADNTYAFSCRPVTGNPGVVSPHSYGRAIDVDPVENPYREPGGTWSPANGRPYVDRSVRRPGMLFADSALTRSLTARGFQWYVGWDYQHFQG